MKGKWEISMGIFLGLGGQNDDPGGGGGGLWVGGHPGRGPEGPRENPPTPGSVKRRRKKKTCPRKSCVKNIKLELPAENFSRPIPNFVAQSPNLTLH